MSLAETFRVAGRLALALVVVGALLTGTRRAAAGQTCIAEKVTRTTLHTAAQTALNLRRELDRSGATVAIVARVGGDISEYGLKYTHAGFVHRHPELAKWIVVHELNDCGTGTSHLASHGLLEFMLDDPLTYDVLVAYVSPSLQSALLDAILAGEPAALFEPRYNLISYPGGAHKYQNSNQWVLEAIAQAQARQTGRPVTTRAAAFDIYRRAGFKPSTINVSALKRLFAGAAANIHFDDHPDQALVSGRYKVVSVRSVVTYLENTGDLVRTVELTATQTW